MDHSSRRATVGSRAAARCAGSHDAKADIQKKSAVMTTKVAASLSVNAIRRNGERYCFGGLIMMWAPAVPGYISHGPGPDVVERPVDSGVANGT